LLSNPNMIESERILFRPFEPEDASMLYEYLNHPALLGRRYLPWGFSDDRAFTRNQVALIIEKWGDTDRKAHFAIVLKETGAVIGHAAAYWRWDVHCPGVEVVISPTYHHKGYGSEALRLLLQWVFDSTLAHNIGVDVADWNLPAQKFFHKHGFQESGRLRREGIREGNFYDLILFDILRREWQRS